MSDQNHNSNHRKEIKVLVAEDNQINQKIVKIMIEKLGHTPKIVANGNAAVEQFLQSQYDLIFMDIHMPVMDGIAATKKIRQIEKETGVENPIIIIALSAHFQDNSDPKISTLGFNDFIEKPFTPDKIKAALDTIA